MTWVVSALTTAVLLNFAFEPFGFGWLAALAMLPLLSQSERPWKQRFAAGWLAGFAVQALGYFWIFFTIRDFGGLSPWLALGGGSLFWAFQGLDLGLWMLVGPMLAHRMNWWQRALVMASSWFAIQLWLFPYVFPWNYGAAYTTFAPLGVPAAWWSMAGLGFLAMLIQTLAIFGWQTGRSPKRWGAAVALILVLWLAGATAVTNQPTENWRAAVIQPNIIPWAKRGRPNTRELFMRHYQPSVALRGENLDLLVWPETALPFRLSQYADYQMLIQQLANDFDCGIVLGTIGRNEGKGYTNEVWLFTPGNAVPQIYAKEKLVLFSEKLPFILSWAKMFDSSLGGFSQGVENKAFEFRDRKLVPLVCFEALFTDYSAKRKGHLIINLTNDAWFGKTKASQQHLQHIQMRSLETGMPLLRATNSGITCWVDPKGEVRDAGPIYEAKTIVYDLPVPLELPLRTRIHGASLIKILAILSLIYACSLQVRHRLQSEKQNQARP